MDREKLLFDFRLIATEFKDVANDTVFDIADMVAPLVSKKRFGKSYYHGLALLVAHYLKMGGYGDNGLGTVEDSMRVASYSEGSVSVSYGTNQGTNLTDDAEYSLTSYGLQFLTLRRKLIVPIMVNGVQNA